MSNAHGSFIWYELMSNDAEASKRFYDDVVGWNIGPMPADGMDYRMISAMDGPVGGVLQLTDDMRNHGARPMWLGYIGVDDVDTTVTAVTAAGGKILMPAWDIPAVGRLAMVTDPQGIAFYLMRGASDHASAAFGRMSIGHVSWNELLTPDSAAALEFYSAVFGINKSGVMDMGPMGEYTFLDHAGTEIGATMTNPPGGGPPGWGFYFRVPDIEAAKDRVIEGGGTVTRGPMEVPGGEWVFNAVDPHGATFGLVAPGM